MVDLENIAIIVNLPAPKSVKQLRTVLGHTGYYRKFIKGYAKITAPMEKLLKKEVKFLWNEECQQSLDTLREDGYSTHLSIPRLEQAISCTCGCIWHRTGDHLNTARRRRY